MAGSVVPLAFIRTWQESGRAEVIKLPRSTLCHATCGTRKLQKVFPLRPWMPLTCANAPLKVACKALA
jgi:hypothetical protein